MMMNGIYKIELREKINNSDNTNYIVNEYRSW